MHRRPGLARGAAHLEPESACEFAALIAPPQIRPYFYEVRKIFGFFDPLLPPLVTFRNQLILFLLSAFCGPPSPLPVRTSYMKAP